MRVLYWVSDIIYIFILYIFPYRKSVVVQNLSRSFPEKRYPEIESIMKKFYRSFCDNLLEALKTVSISPSKQAAKVTLIHPEVITQHVDSGRNVIIGMGHCGNWEVLTIMSHIFNKYDCYSTYKPLRRKVIDRLFLRTRSRFGMGLVPSKSIIRHFIANKKPSIYFFIADQCPRNIEEKYSFELLHQKTYMFSGIEKLSIATDSVVTYIQVTKEGRNKYRVECKEITSQPKLTAEREITQKYTHLLEQNIKAQPYSWLWSHRRWKR